MTWEETIEHIRQTPSYAALVEDAFLGPDLEQNVERFRNSREFQATLEEITKVCGQQKDLHILDIGAGNGISTIAFALEGYQVTASEPDPSETIGAGAIRQLAQHHQLDKVAVIEEFGESLPFEDTTFDVVYGRQVMHHAYDLDQFAADLFRVLKKGGVLMTTRDHVVDNPKEKEQFLQRHPLQKFYGGENAFSVEEYVGAMKKAGFSIVKTLSPSASPINYSPWSEERLDKMLGSKVGPLKNIPFVKPLAWKLILRRLENLPGRLYSIVAKKS